MSNIVSLGFQTTVTTTGAAAAEIRTDASTRIRIREIGIFLGIATACVYGIGRPAARGITPTSPKDFLPYDVADVVIAGSIQSAVAWGTGPTIPADFIRRAGIPGAIGGGMILTFDDLIIPVSGSIVLWNLQTNANNVNIYVVGEY